MGRANNPSSFNKDLANTILIDFLDIQNGDSFPEDWTVAGGKALYSGQ